MFGLLHQGVVDADAARVGLQIKGTALRRQQIHHIVAQSLPDKEKAFRIVVPVEALP